MDFDLRESVISRLSADYELKKRGGDWMRGGRCPSCGKKELYCRSDSPWIVMCGREAKCGDSWHVKDLYPDLFEDWSKRAPSTPKNPLATAQAYLAHNRGFDLDKIKGWFTQESYFDRELNEGSATVRFALEKGGWWERIIDRPHRFDKKARFKYGESFRGRWWCPPTTDLKTVDELWIVEGIFDAIALMHVGIPAVSAMSCNVFPEESLKDLAELRKGKLPTLVWALDNETGKSERNGPRAYMRRWAKAAAALGYRCESALLPLDSGLDWNDAVQRWQALPEPEAALEKALDQARYEGSLLLAASPEDKGILMYQRRGHTDFYFSHMSRLFWFKFDAAAYTKAIRELNELAESGHEKYALANEKQIEREALSRAGCISEIANCYPKFLYYQRNQVTDEAWYYAQVDFPHDSGSVKNTFTGAQVAACSEFKKRLIHMAPGAVFTGSGQQLDRIIKDQLFNIKQVDTVDFIGYSKEYQAYIYNDIAVRDGVISRVNAEDYFEFGRTRIKTLQKSVSIHVGQDEAEYRADWQQMLWTTFGAQGVIALAFWFGSLFCEQIREQHKSFPFIEITGEAGAGKTTLLTFLWKLLGRDYEGFDPSKSTRAGRRRHMGQVSGMPVVLIEADRNEPDRVHAKGFDFDELKDFFGGGTLGTTGVKTGGNETYEPPFRGTICISQNAPVSASEAILTRIVKLHFKRPQVTAESRAAADNLNLMPVEELSHFLLKAVKLESQVLAKFNGQVKHHEIALRTMKEIRIERIIKNHAQIMALVDALELVTEFSREQLKEVREMLMTMALERQHAISADHPSVAEFWEVYEYLEMRGGSSAVNHSKDSGVIAINLNEMYEKASEHRQNLTELKVMRQLLRNSRSRQLIEINKAVSSAIRTTGEGYAAKSATVKCWIFKKGV